ncbi:DUF167 domain-containing protein [Candidatus Woesearchaeota archaeon]|nr:DUF167 domain-containing protein [Candidatus Woesearchaeota archaeon]
MIISVFIVPNSKNSEVIKISGNGYKVKVDAPALKNKANKRLIEVLSEYFKVSKSSISIIRGIKSKSKIVKIDL